jgi:hypothetical protein
LCWWIHTRTACADYPSELHACAKAIEKSNLGQTALPAILEWFPKENIANEYAVRLIPDRVLDLRMLKSGCAGQYAFGKVFIISESSPDAADQCMKK